MSNSLIFLTGVFCFAMTMLGVGLTILEFKRITRTNTNPVLIVKTISASVETIKARARAS